MLCAGISLSDRRRKYIGWIVMCGFLSCRNVFSGQGSAWACDFAGQMMDGWVLGSGMTEAELPRWLQVCGSVF